MKRLKFHKLNYYFKSKLTRRQKTLFGFHVIDDTCVAVLRHFEEPTRIALFNVKVEHEFSYDKFLQSGPSWGEFDDFFDRCEDYYTNFIDDTLEWERNNQEEQ